MRAHYDAGVCFVEAKRPDDAKKVLEALLRDFPNEAEWTQRAREALDKIE